MHQSANVTRGTGVVEPSARANDLIPTAAVGAAASLFIAALAFSHLLLPLLAGLAVLSVADLVAILALGLSRLAMGRARRG